MKNVTFQDWLFIYTYETPAEIWGKNICTCTYIQCFGCKTFLSEMVQSLRSILCVCGKAANSYILSTRTNAGGISTQVQQASKRNRDVMCFLPSTVHQDSSWPPRSFHHISSDLNKLLIYMLISTQKSTCKTPLCKTCELHMKILRIYSRKIIVCAVKDMHYYTPYNVKYVSIFVTRDRVLEQMVCFMVLPLPSERHELCKRN